MIIDLRESETNEIELLITKKQLRSLLKDRVYSLFGLNEEMGLKRYSDKEYRAAIQGAITFEADSLIDILEDFTKASTETQDIIASFFRYRMLHYFGDEISVRLGRDFKDYLISKLFQISKVRLITDIIGLPTIETYNKCPLGGKIAEE